MRAFRHREEKLPLPSGERVGVRGGGAPHLRERELSAASLHEACRKPWPLTSILSPEGRGGERKERRS